MPFSIFPRFLHIFSLQFHEVDHHRKEEDIIRLNVNEKCTVACILIDWFVDAETWANGKKEVANSNGEWLEYQIKQLNRSFILENIVVCSTIAHTYIHTYSTYDSEHDWIKIKIMETERGERGGGEGKSEIGAKAREGIAKDENHVMR